MNQEKTGDKREVYFFDTYALIEIINGNKNYENYKKSQAITTILNLYELYYNLLKEHHEEAKTYFVKILDLCVEIYPEFIIEASEFKLKHIKKNLSYADCLGYIMALRFGVKFLTGDKQFENLENVEFVK